MSFMMKKKRYKFHVNFELEELSSVPFVSGMLFAKIRLLDGGSYTEQSTREEVWEHRVRWRCKLAFACKMVANANTGVLEPCVCRVSVRKEVKGGKSFQKLGFADINLAEFAGQGLASKRYLLEGYDSKRRQDNSTLKVNIEMTLLSGDPCFKVSSQSHSKPRENEDLHAENKGASGNDEMSEGSMASGSSGFGSLPRKQRTSLVAGSDLGGSESDVKRDSDREAAGQPSGLGLGQGPDPGHSRTSSYASQQSKASGYSSTHTGSHSRQSSMDSTQFGHTRSGSSGSCTTSKTDTIGSVRLKKLEGASDIERRVGSTRVDADELVNELIQGTDFEMDENAETSGLHLYVAKDGKSTALSSQQIKSDGLAGKFEQVVIEQR